MTPAEDTPANDLCVPGVTDAVEIGSGGFGVVYRAVEADLRRSVAVKVLRRLDQRGRDRFDRERQAMGSLSGHPNIVTVYRSGFTPDGKAFIVMEFLEPGSMDDLVRHQGPMTWRDATKIGVEIAGALETAHQSGVLHRDIKPGNILMAPTGTAKLGDFGIARISGSPETTSSTITASVAHAAPEVIDGNRPTAAADVYSLASTMYELVAGHPPFFRSSDESMVPMLARIARDPIPGDASLPRGLYDELSRAMAKSPADRHPSAAAFGQSLQLVLDADGQPGRSGPVVMQTTSFAPPPKPVANTPAPATSAPPAPPPSTAASPSGEAPTATPSSNRTVLLALGTAALVVAAGFLAFVLTRDDADSPPTTEATGTSTASTPTSDAPVTETPVTEAPTTNVAAGLPLATASDYDAYSTVFDQTGALRVEIPTAWSDTDLGVLATQPTLLAAPDLATAAETFDQPGVAITVSRAPLTDPGALLEAASDPDCERGETGPYADALYRGEFLAQTACDGTSARLWIVVAAPEANDFTIVVVIQGLTDRDETAARRILDTFIVEGLAL